MNKEMRKEFRSELQTLLNKYNVWIQYECEGDTYGIYNEKMCVRDNTTREPIMKCNDSWLNLKEMEDL